MGTGKGPRHDPRPVPRHGAPPDPLAGLAGGGRGADAARISLDSPPLRAAPQVALRIDDAKAPIYSVGQVSDLLGVQVAFLRRLDSEQLVSPSRSEGGQRRYSREEIERVWRVASMAEEGITLVGIRRIFELEAELSELKREVQRLQGPTGSKDGPGQAGLSG